MTRDFCSRTRTRTRTSAARTRTRTASSRTRTGKGLHFGPYKELKESLRTRTRTNITGYSNTVILASCDVQKQSKVFTQQSKVKTRH